MNQSTRKSGWDCCNGNLPKAADPEVTPVQMECISQVANAIVSAASEHDNPADLAVAIVIKLLNKGIPRNLIDDYFRSEKSVLFGRYLPSSHSGGWGFETRQSLH